MTTKLAPCPFCGVIPRAYMGHAWCNEDGCPASRLRSMPVEQWNTRPDLLRIKELEEKVKELEHKLQSAENEIEDMKPYLGSGKMTGWRL